VRENQVSNITKQDILVAIRRSAIANGGTPLGQRRFEKETGINPYDWGKYWARFGEAQIEAGLLPNQRQGAYDDNFLIEKLIGIARKLGKFPTYRELQVERNRDTELPDKRVFQRLGTKAHLAHKVIDYCRDNDGYADIIHLCEAVIGQPHKETVGIDSDIKVGEVYLFRSGRYYKIGKTIDTVRRGKELRVQLPEECTMIHAIKTDDPSGIEAYWHKRFEAKRMKGEWFDLNSSDIKAFKRWKRIL
jgi:hypothetical protein